jgi:hypothetical protein
VLAVSGTYSDRFPQTAGAPITRFLTSFDLDKFSYFGPRFAGNVAGRSRTMAGLLLSMLENPVKDRERLKSVKAVLDCLGFGTRVQVILEPRKTLKSHLSRQKQLRQQGERVLGFLRGSNAPSAVELQQFLMALDYDVAEREIHRRDVVVDLGKIGDADVAQFRSLAAFVKTGLLHVAELSFAPVNRPEAVGDERISLEDLSSGQLQLLTNLLNLALCVKDDALVLIDEPENSLHPEWQRDYVSLLRKSLACAKRCHIVIATHSPLVASGVRRGEGSLIGLKRNTEDGSLEVTRNATVHGWLPSTVLEERFDMESVRAPALTNAVETALKLLKSKDGDKSRLLQACAELKALLRELPPDDVIVPAIEAIIELGEA